MQDKERQHAKALEDGPRKLFSFASQMVRIGAVLCHLAIDFYEYYECLAAFLSS